MSKGNDGTRTVFRPGGKTETRPLIVIVIDPWSSPIAGSGMELRSHNVSFASDPKMGLPTELSVSAKTASNEGNSALPVSVEKNVYVFVLVAVF